MALSGLSRSAGPVTKMGWGREAVAAVVVGVRRRAAADRTAADARIQVEGVVVEMCVVDRCSG